MPHVVTKRLATKADDGDGVRGSRAMLAYVVKAETPKSDQIIDPFVTLYADGMAIAPPLDPEMLLLLADENAAHSACLDAKADDSVGRGWTLEPTDSTAPAGEGPAPEADESPVEPADERPGGAGTDAEAAVDTLSDALEGITPDYTFAELLWQAAWEKDAIGWSAWEVVREGDPLKGKIAALYPAPAHTIRCTKDPDIFVQIRGGAMRYFVRFGSDAKVSGKDGKRYDEAAAPRRARNGGMADGDQAHELLMFRGYSSRSQWYPLPRWVAAIPAIAELTAIREFNVAFYGSGGVVDRIIHATAADDGTAQKLADSVKDQLETAGAEGGAHLTIATGGTPGSGIDVKFLTPTQGRRDGQFGARRGELIEEVLMAHKVPGYRVSRAIVGALGGAPTRDMLHTYRTGTIEPIQGILESRLNQELFGPKGIDLQNYSWRLEDLDWDESQLDLDLATSAFDHGLVTGDEGRDMIGLGATNEPSMQKFYYKGVELGAPRPAAPPFGTPAAAATATLEALRARASARLKSKAATNGNGNGKHVPAGELVTLAKR